MADLFDGSYIAFVTDEYKQFGVKSHSDLGRKKFKDLDKAKTWAINYGRKYSSSGKFIVTIKQDYYHTVYEKRHS